ncbi:hypothetical protein GCM10018785_45900 [Streptomyces longispororuber]|uniref:DUF4232 domain-containing protein n=1 Tax=Streptomyces longispororuber TaxID=68230 RepID=A0A918ZWI4_9ACTN|nr:hypothetical protein [Streptomyces longispororuber]GHE72576.1 hypothetical protein GCM10018785_45900 [Streptomyces longispororuber]
MSGTGDRERDARAEREAAEREHGDDRAGRAQGADRAGRGARDEQGEHGEHGAARGERGEHDAGNDTVKHGQGGQDDGPDGLEGPPDRADGPKGSGRADGPKGSGRADGPRWSKGPDRSDGAGRKVGPVGQDEPDGPVGQNGTVESVESVESVETVGLDGDLTERLRGLGRLTALDGGANRSAGPGPGGADDLGEPAGLADDELALRRLLRSAVQDIEPADSALDKLRHAVPARRARKRQALAGAAAVVLFAVTAVPALVHVTRSAGDSDARPSIAGAGKSQESQGGSGEASKAAERPGKDTKPDEKDKKDKKDGKEKGSKGKEKGGKGKGETGRGGATGGGTEPGDQDTDAASSPACDAAQLGDASGSVTPADADGKVYGTFRIANVSGSSCTVTSPGAVAATAQGATDPAAVNVVDHTAGDAATGLPDPAQEATSLVLKPGAAYEVRFAWVPSAACPSDGGEPSPNPSPSEGGGTGGTGTEGAGGEGGVTTQLVPEDGTKDGSVALSLTAEPGAPSAAATVPNACSGTVYKTGVLPAQ